MRERGKQMYGVASYIGEAYETSALARALKGGTVLVDGREIRGVCFADTHAGIVKTYDVFGDREWRFGHYYTPADFPGREVACPQDDLLVETLHGKVELFAKVEVEPVAQ